MTPATALRSLRPDLLLAAAAILALALTACGGQPWPAAATTPPAAKPTATNPADGHPLLSNASPAAAACTQTDTHAVHLKKFGCDTCHPAGATYGFDVPHVFPRGTTTAGGTVVPRTATTPTSCTVACHYPSGAAAHAVTWTTPGPLACTACHDTTRLPAAHPAVLANAARADCQVCHTMTSHLSGTVVATGHAPAWMDQASPGFHASSANQGLAACQACHGAALDGVGGTATTSCASCHDVGLPAGVTSWKVNCVMCHGGTGNQTGAPPRTTWGNTADAVRVGAHASHVNAGTAIAPAFDCGVCHVKPTDALSAGHVDSGPAEVVFAGLAAQGSAPAWTRASASCAATYCHGATLLGGTNTAPTWTSVGTGQAACGTCHGLPPPAPHPAASGLASCVTCHPATMNAAGQVIAPSAGGKHLDGLIQSTGGHGAAWMDQASAGFHAYSANRSLSACQGCHGVNLDGVGGTATTACATCHGATWRTTCTMCHGGTFDTTGAPPKATWGSTSANATGAHASHLAATHGLTVPLDCVACHVKPANALAPGHADGTAAVTGYTGSDAALVAAVGSPGWSGASATCGTSYCHGATLAGGGTNKIPVWTQADGTQVACTSCHEFPPATGKPMGPVGAGFVGHTFHMAVGLGCANCHAGYGYTTANTAVHINGKVEVNGNITSWNPQTGSCVGCHALCKVNGVGPVTAPCTWY
jgi:predicted CxxxxCH...CXXCH cytochrome family protein